VPRRTTASFSLLFTAADAPDADTSLEGAEPAEFVEQAARLPTAAAPPIPASRERRVTLESEKAWW